MQRCQSILSYITICGLLLATLLPFYVSYPVQASDDLSSLFGDKILICTADGYKWVDVADLDGEPHDETEAQCPLCITTAFEQKGLLPGSAVIGLVQFDAVTTALVNLATDIPTTHTRNHHAPRAPPVS